MDNSCICCGAIIPEGRQICPQCEDSLKNYNPIGVKTLTIKKFIAEVNNDGT